jgi:hypothetical protein
MFDRFVVPHDLSIKLNEVGFDMPCNGVYNDNEDYFTCKVYSQKSGKGLLAPTYEEAFDWFLESHGYYPLIELNEQYNKWLSRYCNVDGSMAAIAVHETNKEAKEAVLKRLIELIKIK